MEFKSSVTPEGTLKPSSVDKVDTNISRTSALRKTLPLHLEPATSNILASTTTSGGQEEASKKVPRLASPETSSIGSSVHSNGGLKAAAKTSNVTSTTSVPKRGQQQSDLEVTPTNSHQSLAHRAIESFNNKVQSLSSKLPKKAWQDEPTSDDEGGFLDTHRPINSLSRIQNKKKSNSTVYPTASATPPICLADSPASDRTLNSSNHSGFKGSGSINSNATVSKLTPISLKLPIGPAAATSSSNTSSMVTSSPIVNGGAALRENLPSAEINGNGTEDPINGLVIITIYPDEKNRFGFNVKGGTDQKMPIIVSRVGANTPADQCVPRLNEGDQVVMINGREVSEHTHDQVVNFIRASSEKHSAQLVLAVRQNVYMPEDVEEPEFQYVPDTPTISPLVPGTQALSQSMLLLEESLESGAITGQFDHHPRKNPSLAMTVCHASENQNKNRYRDISPYDITRVKLTECPTGDYINANHVVMNIPGSGIKNRYIATQGPLATTCTDFWYMIWECQSTLIIMLTTIVERGRIKCHKYWPDIGTTSEFGGLEVTCIKEETNDNFVFREFSILLKETAEERQVTQMAYLSWPDHGVPDSSQEFVDFVEAVRSHRQGSLAPTIVHCSAGIGRTGVVILMETALYLIEANQPVYPLDLTRVMRDQRASMIQTPGQYKFVCQAILKVYKEGKVKPSPEFCQTTTSVSVGAIPTGNNNPPIVAIE